jgi:hypothetical protein
MHIINLKAENIKKLTAIDITPSDNMIMVTGANGAGKSSVLDCIVMALCGGKSIPAVPIKKGEDKGKIVIELEGYQITRSFTKESSYLKIEGTDGAKISSPQAFLDKIVGNISFDPLDFLNNEKKKQRDILLSLLGIDVDEIDKREKAARENRTIIGRDKDKAEAVYKSAATYPEITATKELSVSDLSAKLTSAVNSNNDITIAQNANERLKDSARVEIERIKSIDAEIAKLNEEKSTLTASVAAKKTQYTETKEKLSKTEVIDISAIESQLSTLESTNEKIRANVNKKKYKAEFDDLAAQYSSATKEIESISKERATLLTSASMPVDGLSFDDGGLLYNGVPLDQASDGEKLMVSLGISMALNPTLRVLRIKDGSLLDERNLEIIKNTVKDREFQIWIERVNSDGKIGIYIEEGEIVAVNGEKVEKKEVRKSTPTPVPSDSKKSKSKQKEEPKPQDLPESKPQVTGDEDW